MMRMIINIIENGALNRFAVHIAYHFVLNEATHKLHIFSVRLMEEVDDISYIKRYHSKENITQTIIDTAKAREIQVSLQKQTIHRVKAK